MISSFFGPTAHGHYRHTCALFVALTSSLLIYHKYTAVAASFPAPLQLAPVSTAPALETLCDSRRERSSVAVEAVEQEHANAAEQAQHQPCDSAASRKASYEAATCS